MPEGPSMVILKEEVQAFKGKKILMASGNSQIDIPALVNKQVVDFKTWGKHFLICLPKLTLRVHFLLKVPGTDYCPEILLKNLTWQKKSL